jgi:hypothetical protein
MMLSFKTSAKDTDGLSSFLEILLEKVSSELPLYGINPTEWVPFQTSS